MPIYKKFQSLAAEATGGKGRRVFESAKLWQATAGLV
jgi:hypothetical protein